KLWKILTGVGLLARPALAYKPEQLSTTSALHLTQKAGEVTLELTRQKVLEVAPNDGFIALFGAHYETSPDYLNSYGHMATPMAHPGDLIPIGSPDIQHLTVSAPGHVPFVHMDKVSLLSNMTVEIIWVVSAVVLVGLLIYASRNWITRTARALYSS